MATGQLGAALRQIERLFTVGSVSGMSEGQLLERFVIRGDEAAFAALMARHGPMVLGVCRQWLRDPNDVEDAFQATFLVLVRKAGSLRQRELLGNWLYGVASRVACRARSNTRRRQGVQGADVEELATDAPAPPEPCPWLHEEVARLPEKYRVPIVLCYLEGWTHEEAAERLGWPIGTVKGRLARARDLLRARLTRRGLAFPAAGLAVQLGRDASAAVPPALVEATTRVALALGAGRAAAVGLISAPVANLLKGTLHAMTLSKLKLLAVPFIIAGAIVTGTAVLADPPGVRKGQIPSPGAPKIGQNGTPKGLDYGKAQVSPMDDLGFPVARQSALSALARIEMAREALKDFESDRIPLDSEKINQWSLRLMEAESELARTPQERIKAIEDHRDRLRKWEKVDRDLAADRGEPGPRNVILNWKFHQMEAERLLAEETKKANRPAAFEGPATKSVPFAPSVAAGMAPRIATDASGPEGGVASDGSVPAVPLRSPFVAAKGASETPKNSPLAKSQPSGMGMMMGGGGVGGMGMGGGVGGMGGGISLEMQKKRYLAGARLEIAEMLPKVEEADKSPKTQEILKKLNEPVAMSFANETPLEDVLKYIKAATAGPKGDCLPIYVDPIGLAEAEKTLTSPVTMDLEGVPLKTTLRLLLKQLGLAYCVKDGLLYISSVDGILQELKEFEMTHLEIMEPEEGGIQ
jgi:RNA polymerase sigma factor (sigma-70 family)